MAINWDDISIEDMKTPDANFDVGITEIDCASGKVSFVVSSGGGTGGMTIGELIPWEEFSSRCADMELKVDIEPFKGEDCDTAFQLLLTAEIAKAPDEVRRNVDADNPMDILKEDGSPSWKKFCFAMAVRGMNPKLVPFVEGSFDKSFDLLLKSEIARFTKEKRSGRKQN
ncbi:hypothetical protein E3J62_00385 [candidate division TA06 bacterium]|uniref:Uncharacterized protein n=1 Tax=candidate division TA06 bacterium TaxID=2250710 RepID=A0A523UZ27_UNCT6|nr:MAG: hypothetical protein E3J62_00385 [candidate division TA06 bacterium]